MKNIATLGAVIALTAAPVFAGGHSNAAEARAMATALASGINQDDTTKEVVSGLNLGSANPNGNAAVPALVSGGGNGGWGNIGSTLTGPEGEDLTTPVSRSGQRR